MSVANQAKRGAMVRPALVTAIAGAELAAALWDSRIFLRLHELFPMSSNFAVGILLPALMAISAIYAGVGLLQMRRSGWLVWGARHLVLGTLYALSLPGLMATELFHPYYSLVIVWRLMIVVFSVVAGGYLYATRHQFDNQGAR